MSLIAKILHFFAGIFLCGVGCVVGLVGVLAVLDPVGAKQSDDSDPFGSTAGIVPFGIVAMVVSIAIIVAGGFMMWRVDRKR